ncbi:hypothetical protein NL526_28210, partial [Klebsiella pneumoniae]|nr:hypothetical protein [Klebsiella pneumoniae]
KMFGKDSNYLRPSWMPLQYTPPSSGVRHKRSPILAAVGLALGASALFNLFSGSMSSRDIADLKSKQAAIYNHIHTLNNQVSANHDDIV